jgi:hypothetical protein
MKQQYMLTEQDIKQLLTEKYKGIFGQEFTVDIESGVVLDDKGIPALVWDVTVHAGQTQ